jgi:hypothetical protein
MNVTCIKQCTSSLCREISALSRIKSRIRLKFLQFVPIQVKTRLTPNPDKPVVVKRKSRFIGEQLPQRHPDTKRNIWLISIFVPGCLCGESAQADALIRTEFTNEGLNDRAQNGNRSRLVSFGIMQLPIQS